MTIQRAYASDLRFPNSVLSDALHTIKKISVSCGIRAAAICSRKIMESASGDFIGIFGGLKFEALLIIFI